MAKRMVTFVFDSLAATGLLSSLAKAAEGFPEFGNALVDFIESGDELFLLKPNRRSASGTNHLVVRLDPSDSLVGLVATFRARNPDFGLLEHFHPATSPADFSTSIGGAQP
ncbi:hypothetical protein NKI12_26820 [Mesorhizobium australicum]|uniref:Uncharacterized protein n=1 Tax=Mesorhizobium australicum TaxID=536018 RepID=A0ACC6T6D6_9HYPH